MKKFLLISTILLISHNYVQSQTMGYLAIRSSALPLISLTCEEGSRGLVYRFQYGPLSEQEYLCDGVNWRAVKPGPGSTEIEGPVGRFESDLNATVPAERSVIPFRRKEAREEDSPVDELPVFTPDVFPVNYHFSKKRATGAKRLEVSGAVTVGLSNTSANTKAVRANGAVMPAGGTNSRELNLALDLHIGTYIIDPKFIKLAFDTSLARDKGSFDDFETRNGIRGMAVSLDFLPTSPYPFRLRYVDQNSSFLNRQGETTDSRRNILGLSWRLRLPKFPSIVVNFDKVSYDSKFIASSFFKTKGQTFSVTATDSFKGWEFNTNYNYQTTEERVTNLNTKQNFLQFHARKNHSKQVNLSLSSFFEKLTFDNGMNGSRQDTTLADSHENISFRPNDRLITRFFHRFYFNATDITNPVMRSDGRPAMVDTTSLFNSFGGYASYRVSEGLYVAGTSSLNLIKAPEDIFESATRLFDAAGTITWSRKVKMFYVHANHSEGIAYAGSNFGNKRTTGYRNFNAGVNFGKAQKVVISADYNYSYRPDIFQIGGFFSDDSVSVHVTSEAFWPYRIEGTFRKKNVEYLTSRGREKYDRTYYAAGVEHRRFSVRVSRNVNDGVRDIFASSFPIPNDRIFIVLPNDTLVRDPFLRTDGSFDSALLRYRPRRDLTVEFRYLNDKTNFVLTDDVRVRQYDVIAYYRLGKFTFSAGLSRQKQITADLFERTRNYYFFRATRRFRIF